MILDSEKLTRIKNALRFKSKGMNISEISRQLKLNRNSVAKYLEILIMSGEVESHPYGTSKIFTISQHVPVSAMLQFSSDMILMIARDGRIIQVNDQFLKYGNTTRESVIGKHYSQTGICLFSDLPIEEFLADESGKKTETFEKTVKNNGKELFIRIKLIRTIFEGGIEGLTIIIDDISERVLAELALVERENLYHSVIKNIEDVFYRSDINGNLILASPNWATILGYDSLDECIGKNIADIFYIDPEERKKFVEAVFKKGSVHDYDVVLRKKDGSPLHVGTNSHLYYDAAGRVLGIEGVFRDISERHKAAEKIRQYVSYIEFLSKKLREFIELPENDDIFEKIGNDLSGLIPDAFISVNSYDPKTSMVTLRSLTPLQDRILCEQVLGREILGIEVPVTQTALNTFRTGVLHAINISLFEFAFQVLPRDKCDRIEQVLNLGTNYAIGFTNKGNIFGNVGIFLHKGAIISDVHLVEAYVQEAAIALQRRIAEDAVRKSEELFYEVAEQSPFPLAIIDTSGNFRFINKCFTNIFGYDLTDFHTGREWFMLVFPDANYRKQSIDIWKSDVTSYPLQGTVPREFSVQCKDGTKKEVLFRMMYLSTKEKCIICQDLTEIRRAEQVQKYLSSIVESSNDAIIGKDLKGLILSWNHAAEHMYGYTAGEIIGQPITKIIPHYKLAEFNDIFNKVLSGQRVTNFETQRIRKDGKRIDVSITLSPIFKDDGSVNGISTISRDISTKKAEERLSENEEKYRALVENMNIGVYRSTGDPKGKFVWGNSSLVEILGYPSLDHLQKINIADIFVEDDGRMKHLVELKHSGFVKNREISLKRADGSSIWVSITALAQFDTDGKIEYINGIVEDITQQKGMSREIEALRTEFFEVIDFFPDALFIVDSQKNVIAWNRVMEKLTGISRENIVGRSGYARALQHVDSVHPVLIDLIDEPDEKILHHFPEVKRENGSLVAVFFAPFMNNGVGAYLRAKAAPFMDGKGNRLGSVEIIRDITEQKKIEACLEYSMLPIAGRGAEATGITHPGIIATPASSSVPSLVHSLYLYQALKNNPDYVVILDPAGKCLWVNDAMLSLVPEIGEKSLIGNNIAQFIAPEFRKITLTCLTDARKEGYKRIPIMFFTHTGRIPVDVTISLIHDIKNDIMGFMAIARRQK